jgi:class 3 adenylate cyclase
VAAPALIGQYAWRVSEDTAVNTNRVVRSFAFIDLSGFTAFTNEEGDDRAVDVLRQFREAVREAASSRGVRIAKWLGDGAMLVGVESEPLIEAVVDIEGRISGSGFPLPLRAGIAVGPVILFEGDDYIGHAVNIAARLCDEAEPREVLAVENAVSSLLVNTDAAPAGDREIRGLDEPLRIVRLTALV